MPFVIISRWKSVLAFLSRTCGKRDVSPTLHSAVSRGRLGIASRR